MPDINIMITRSFSFVKRFVIRKYLYETTINHTHHAVYKCHESNIKQTHPFTIF